MQRSVRRLQKLSILCLSLAACSAEERAVDDAAMANEDALDSVARSATDSSARATQDSINRARPGYIVDSLFPPEEALRRFQAEIRDPPAALADGAESRDALVRTWVTALEAADSVTLIRAAVNRPEFAFLVYPSSPNAKEPFYQPPGLVWSILSNSSVKGFRRALSRLGGKPLGFVSYRCATTPEPQGHNRLWTNCVVRRTPAPGDTVEQELFGAIIQRDGRFKFLSLANEM